MKYFLGIGCLLFGFLFLAVGAIELSSENLLSSPGRKWFWLFSLVGERVYTWISGLGFALFGAAVIVGGIAILRIKEK